MPASASGSIADPGGAVRTVGSPTNGAARTPAANFALNSPKDVNCARSRIRPNVATSQNAEAPPSPMMIS